MTEHTAFVTGASRGIGREIALHFADAGSNVALVARSDGVEETAELIGEESRTLAIRADVTDESAVERAVAETVETFGGLNCLVNNAGIAGPTGPVESLERSDWDETLAVKLTGAFLTTKYAVKPLCESGLGSIVNIASVAGKRPYELRVPYAVANIGLIGLTRTLAFELADDNVTVNAVCPGPVRGERLRSVIRTAAEERGLSYEAAKEQVYTDHMPLGELVEPDEVARLVVSLADGSLRHMTGQDINLSSGRAWY